jgi:hypothetical protein
MPGNCCQPAAAHTRSPAASPLDRVLRTLARQATDPSVRRWAAALARGEAASGAAAARGQAVPAVPGINGVGK